MFARSTTLVGDPHAVDAVVGFVRDEVMPAVTQMEGCYGMSLVVERASGRCIATSSWTSQAAMTQSDDSLAPQRAHAGRLMSGRAMVEEWYVALMHRDHASMVGACCRITWAKTSEVDKALETFRANMLPRLERADGFCSTSIFVDRGQGRVCVTVTFDSGRALRATGTLAKENRDLLEATMDVVIEEVAELELELAHLRVPELV
jgi:heme-degrading monooxygenase HmoA